MPCKYMITPLKGRSRASFSPKRPQLPTSLHSTLAGLRSDALQYRYTRARGSCALRSIRAGLVVRHLHIRGHLGLGGPNLPVHGATALPCVQQVCLDGLRGKLGREPRTNGHICAAFVPVRTA